MANPRKFSEKIALLNQKEAEGNAEFERIMREVSEVASKVSQTSSSTSTRNTNLIAATSAFISRSLPNVNAPINNANNVNDIDDKGDEPSPTTLAGLLTAGYSNDISQSDGADSKTTSRESRGRSVGGGPMRSRRNIDTSPYSNTAYLSPPQESSWRRTSSDSAIHQSLAQAQDIHNNVQSLMLSPRTHKRLSNSQSNSMKNLHQQHQNQPINQQHSHSQQNMHHVSLLTQQQNHIQQQNISQHLTMNNNLQEMKSRSVSRLPGIPVYPSQNNELLQIPVGNSTGSLPDLTLVHFQSPISNPIDPHDQLITVTSSFNNTNPSFSMASTNHTTTNQQLPSMASQQQQQQQQQQMFTQMGNNLDQCSPNHYNSNGNNNGKGSSSQGLLIQQGTNGSHNFTQHPQQSSPIPIDSHQRQQSPSHHQSYPNQMSVDKMMSYRSSNAASPAAGISMSMSQGNLSKNSYRSSPNHRPSPGSSPIGNVPGLSANFDSNSSAPCSPSPQMTGNNGQFDTYPPSDTFYLNPSIQQHFEQFSLDWNSLVQSLVDSGCTISTEVKVDNSLPDYITATNDQNNYSQNIDTYNGILNDSPNRQPTNRNNVSRPNSRNACISHHQQQQQQHSPSTNNHDGSSPHSPIGSDTMLSGSNYDNLRNMLGSSSPLDGALMNGVNNGGINDIMLGAGIGSDSTSKLITSCSQSSLMTSSPSHQLNHTPTAIPEIILSEHIDYSTGSIDFTHDLLPDNFLELGMNSTELQMTFDNASIIDPSIEENFRRDLY